MTSTAQYPAGTRVTVRHETDITETGTVQHHNVAAGLIDVHFDGDTYCSVPAFRVILATPAPRRIFSVVDATGDLLMHWRCTEADARHFAKINHLQTAAGNRLVGPTGETIETFGGAR